MKARVLRHAHCVDGGESEVGEFYLLTTSSKAHEWLPQLPVLYSQPLNCCLQLQCGPLDLEDKEPKESAQPCVVIVSFGFCRQQLTYSCMAHFVCVCMDVFSHVQWPKLGFQGTAAQTTCAPSTTPPNCYHSTYPTPNTTAHMHTQTCCYGFAWKAEHPRSHTTEGTHAWKCMCLASRTTGTRLDSTAASCNPVRSRIAGVLCLT